MKFGNRPWPATCYKIYQSAQLRQSQSYGTWMNSASITVHTSRVHGRKLQITMDDWSNHRADRACMICVSSSLVKRYSASARSPLSYLHHLDGSCKTMIRFPTIDSFETAYTACQSDRIHSILFFPFQGRSLPRQLPYYTPRGSLRRWWRRAGQRTITTDRSDRPGESCRGASWVRLSESHGWIALTDSNERLCDSNVKGRMNQILIRTFEEELEGALLINKEEKLQQQEKAAKEEAKTTASNDKTQDR